ncbi:unnamed protein product [Rotaria sordida]|uniref:Uncharacterized protein n=1 Tax=Rotaria sordida TaxID=392033 RepID=A0A815IGS0_9BILA|nr:unnamed protein product [Rotaria sordida]
MDHLQQQQPFNDSNPNEECIEPNTSSKHELQTSFKELCDQQTADFPKKTQYVKQLVNNANIEKELALSGNVVPTSLAVIPQLSGLGELSMKFLV